MSWEMNEAGRMVDEAVLNERARIRRELEEKVSDLAQRSGAGNAWRVVKESELLVAMDRICPKEPSDG